MTSDANRAATSLLTASGVDAAEISTSLDTSVESEWVGFLKIMFRFLVELFRPFAHSFVC